MQSKRKRLQARERSKPRKTANSWDAIAKRFDEAFAGLARG
jgi:hypothetical protein